MLAQLRKMMHGGLAAGLVALASVVLPNGAWADEPIVADLSKHLVAITTGFAGSDVLLFGAVEDEGDVVVVVRGPDRSETVRKKDRQAGIWINKGQAEIIGAPSFYWVAASRPIGDLAPLPVLERHQIGLDNLKLPVTVMQGDDTAPSYREALIRLKQTNDLYSTKVQNISFLGRRLFRTEMHFPANVPVGTYTVEVLLLRDGQVVSAQTTPLIVSKIGVGAEIFEFAHRHSAFYGIIAVLVAAFAGWLAAAAFKKR